MYALCDRRNVGILPRGPNQVAAVLSSRQINKRPCAVWLPSCDIRVRVLRTKFFPYFAPRLRQQVLLCAIARFELYVPRMHGYALGIVSV